MVTTFNTKDLVSFGRYLSSPERTSLFESTQERAATTLEERLADVYHSDIENWKALQNSPKDKSDIHKALSLMNSMILSGESHTQQSEEIFRNAIQQL